MCVHVCVHVCVRVVFFHRGSSGDQGGAGYVRACVCACVCACSILSQRKLRGPRRGCVWCGCTCAEC